MTGKVPGTHHFRTCRSLPRSVTMIHNTTLLSQVVTISSLDQFFTSEAMTLKVNCFWDWKVTHEGINYARFGPYVGEVKKLSTRSSSSPYIPSTPWSSSAVPRNNVMNFPTKRTSLQFFSSELQFTLWGVQSLALLASQRLLEAHQLLQQHLSSAVAGQSLGDVSLSTSLNCKPETQTYYY